MKMLRMQTTTLTRRHFVAHSGALIAATSLAAASLAEPAQAAEAPRTIGLGFSLYGMKSLSIGTALKVCADIGYDCVELPVMPDWPADSAKLAQQARREIRAQLAERSLRLAAIMENLPALGSDDAHRANLDRLKRACEVMHDLTGDGAQEQAAHAVPIETILGGKPGQFDEVKEQFVERLAEWAQVLKDAKVKLAIKAHVTNATQRPEQLVWLLEKIASPWLVAAYDYSHFELQELKMAETMAALLPRAAFIHVKDTERAVGKKGFLLPGEGATDYGEYFGLVKASSYQGDVVVEVSGQVFGKAGYDPLAAARQCYNHLAPAMQRAGIQRA
jgi:sugar phosphate isomerase/epimerase